MDAVSRRHVVVIGAGMVGLAIAWRLHRDGHDVTVVDPAPASGATHAAGGMLTPVGEVHHGEEHLSGMLLASAQRYPGFVADLADHLPEGTPTGLRTAGTLICGADAADRRHLADLHALSARLGLAFDEVSTRQARRLEPLLGPRVSCAFLAPEDHQVDPRVLAAALLRGLTEPGGAPATGADTTAAVEIVADSATAVNAGPPARVGLAGGRELRADVVVVANGLGAGGLAGDLPAVLGNLVRPVYGEVMRMTAPPHLAPLLDRTIRGLVEGRPVYLVPRGDGRVLLGASSREDGREHVSVGGVHDLLVDAVRLMPAVQEFGIDEVLARPRPGTPDNAPLLGEVAPGIVLATGFFRHGILLAPFAADVVCALVRRHVGEPGPAGERDSSDADPPADSDLLALAGPADPARFSRRGDSGRHPGDIDRKDTT